MKDFAQSIVDRKLVNHSASTREFAARSIAHDKKLTCLNHAVFADGVKFNDPQVELERTARNAKIGLTQCYSPRNRCAVRQTIVQRDTDHSRQRVCCARRVERYRLKHGLIIRQR